VGGFRRDPRPREPHRRLAVRTTAFLWVAVVALALYLLAFFVERGFLL
jgi:hypothetical protein